MASRKIEADVVIKVTGEEDLEAVAEQVRELSDTTSTVTVEVDGDERVEQLTKEFEGLDNVTVTATAKVSNAATVDEFVQNVRAFDGETATAILAVRTGQAEAEVRNLIVTIGDLNSTDAEVQVATDKLPAAKAELDQLRQAIVDVDNETGGASEGLRKVGAAGGEAGNVVSNAVGNSVQDLAQLGGVAGTTGQALGQMAEVLADAASKGGGFGPALSGIVAALGPIAAITAAVGIVTAAVQAFNKPAEDAAERTEALGEAMDKSGNDALGFADVLRENSSALQDFIADANDPLGGFGTAVDEAASHIPFIGDQFKEAGTNVIDAADRAGLSIFDLGKQIEGTGLTTQEFHNELQAAADAGKITGDEMRGVEEAIAKYGDSAKQAAKDTKLFALSTEEANALLVEGQDPLTRYPGLWRELTSDMKDGNIETRAGVDAWNDLAEKLGLTPEKIRDLALDKLADDQDAAAQATEDAAKAAEDQAKAAQEAAEAINNYTIKVLAAQGAMNQLAGGFDLLATRGTAMQSIFDLGNAPLDALSDMQDVEQGIRDFSEFVRTDLKGKLPNIFNPDDVNADDFLAKIESLRGPIQEQISAAFASGGPVAAQQVADNYVNQIVASLGGKLTAEEVRSLLNLGDLQAKIDVALDQSRLATARASLATLVGLTGETPWTASIALALQTGAITPEVAQTLINQKLAGAGVEIPATLQTPDAGQATVAAAQWSKDHPVELTTGANTAGASKDVAGFAGGTQPTATVPIDGDNKEGKAAVAEVKSTADKTKPIIDVSANIQAALITMAIINAIARAMAPTVDIHSDTSEVYAALGNISRQRPRVPVEAYLSDYPTASEIAARIGRPRIPVDIVVGQSIRITGVRE